jgi:hypothetical protein
MTRRSRPGLRLESLESRLTMAGDVAASLSGETLSLRGDEAANSVRITQDANASILIEGLDGTRINGASQVRYNGAGLEKSDLRLFGGNDRLEIRGLRATVDHNLELDVGNDAVILQDVVAGVNLTVKMDDGVDRVTASGVRTGSDLNIEMGQGAASVTVSASTVAGTLNVQSLDSADSIQVTATTVGKDLKINSGKGDDSVTVQNVQVALTATAITDEGRDRVTLTNLVTTEDVNVEAGQGADRVLLTEVRSGKNITVLTDTGNDYVSVTRVVAAKDAVFAGGDEFDTFDNNGVSGGEKLEIKEFEARTGLGTTPPTAPPLSNFVRSLYVDVLNRSASDDDVSYWSGRLEAGATRSAVSSALLASRERRAAVVDDYYRQYLGRPADAGGLSFWLNVWQTHNGPDVVRAGLIGSGEFYASQGGSDDGAIRGLYQNVLGRGASDEEVGYWRNVIKSTPLTNVALGFLNSRENRRELIDGWYQNYLNRSGDNAGLDYWFDRLSKGASQESIQASLLGSSEYFD